MEQECSHCSKSPPEVKLKKCAKCSTTPYCSRECQKADWKAHKKICAKQAAAAAAMPLPGFMPVEATNDEPAEAANDEHAESTSDESAEPTEASPPKEPQQAIDQQAIDRPPTRLGNGTRPRGRRPRQDVNAILMDDGSPNPKAGNAASPPQGLQQGITRPFTRLDRGTWLWGRPEQDVYALLIDAYRLRLDDVYRLDGEAEAGSIYAGAASGLRGFRRFLARVAARPGLLPPWWDAGKKAACERLGMRPGSWLDLRAAVEKSDIIERYGDRMFPMQLRMFAESVYGRTPGGSNGMEMRAMMMAVEEAGGYQVMPFA